MRSTEFGVENKLRYAHKFILIKSLKIQNVTEGHSFIDHAQFVLKSILEENVLFFITLFIS